jgi:hypothetical protein
MTGVGRLLRRCAVGCLLGGALTIPLGPTTTSSAVDRINGMSTRPLPSAQPRPVVRDSMTWVPDRWVVLPGDAGQGVLVPGHWERTLPGGRVHVPPATVFRPSTGRYETLPAGEYPPATERLSP